MVRVLLLMVNGILMADDVGDVVILNGDSDEVDNSVKARFRFDSMDNFSIIVTLGRWLKKWNQYKRN